MCCYHELFSGQNTTQKCIPMSLLEITMGLPQKHACFVQMLERTKRPSFAILDPENTAETLCVCPWASLCHGAYVPTKRMKQRLEMMWMSIRSCFSQKIPLYLNKGKPKTEHWRWYEQNCRVLFLSSAFSFEFPGHISHRGGGGVLGIWVRTNV